MPLSSDPQRRARQLANLRAAPPAPAGHRRSLTHGAYARVSRERLDGKVAELVEAITADAPVKEHGQLPAADGAVVRQVAEVLCRLENISEYLDRRGWEGEDGKPRPVLEYEAQLRRHLLDLLRELGMTPASRAKLGLDLARTRRTLEDELESAGDPWAGHDDVIDGTAAEQGGDDAGA